MKKNNGILNNKVQDAIAKLAKSSDKVSTSLNEVASAVLTKEQIEEALKLTEQKKLEEWIWVEGYKGTNKDMTCRDYQFMIGVKHEMPEGAKIEVCDSGFHFCLKLEDVFNYYNIGEEHRFFKVRGLVRKADFEKYGKYTGLTSYYPWMIPASRNVDKLAAKSIEFMSELTADEILASINTEGWTDEDKQLALKSNIAEVKKVQKVRDLMSLGYSDMMSKHIVYSLDKYEIAKALISQTDISMDTRIMILFDKTSNSDTATWWNKSFVMPNYEHSTSIIGTIDLAKS